MSTKITFAGTTFKPTKKGRINRRTLCKILRSPHIRVRLNYRYTDDYAWDAATDFGRKELAPQEILQLAKDIEKSPSGWVATPVEGMVSLRCYHFLRYTIQEVRGA